MLICGIHSGDASAAGDMSWVTYDTQTRRKAYQAT